MTTKPVLYMTAEERREVLREYGQKYGMEVLVETGTNNGDTPMTLKGNFTQIYTIELDKTLYLQAQKRLAPYRHIHPLFGDSTEVLGEVLKEINQSSLFWLDGHCSGPGTAHGKYDTPIVQELEVLFSDEHQHVILIDDARIFKGQPEHHDYPHYQDYPSCEWVEKVALEAGYDFEMKDDIMRLTPHAA